MSGLGSDRKAGVDRSAEDKEEPSLDEVREALRGLRYGSVLVIVQDGVIVQLDRTEKRRLRTPEHPQ
jgi:hypothetical protein